MEIEFKDKKNYVRFGDIKKGDIFLFNGKIFMKCQKIGNYTAIDLADGSSESIEETYPVMKLMARVVIE